MIQMPIFQKPHRVSLPLTRVSPFVIRHSSFVILTLLLGCSPEKPVAPLTELKAYPPEINLSAPNARQRIVLQATYADGVTRDVTSQARFALVNEGLARLDCEDLTIRRVGERSSKPGSIASSPCSLGSIQDQASPRFLFPLADGRTELRVSFSDRALTVPIVLTNILARPAQHGTNAPGSGSPLAQPAISFKLDVMPVFMKAGCNAGSCHGSSRGKDGFHLSLFGYDPDGDYFRLTREQIGRRINLAIPEESLIVLKGLGAVQHTGGVRFATNSELHRTLLAWLNAGAPKDPPDVPKLAGLEIFPASAVLSGPQASQRFLVRARYSDGAFRDVTSLAVFISNNDVTAKVTEDGLVTAGQRGEAFIQARFGEFNVGSEIIVIPNDITSTPPPRTTSPQVSRITHHRPPSPNYIDDSIQAKLKKLRLVSSEVCDDSTFIRRASLDITGTLPAPEEIVKFNASTNSDKRAHLVEQLLDRKEFAELWVMKWAELLQIRSSDNRVYPKATLLYFEWLRDQMLANVPLDRIVQSLLTASDSNLRNPPSNYYQIEPDALKLAENTAQIFMGMRIQCAQCHNHPFDRWTMNDYYGFAGFFAQVGRKPGDDPRETILFDRHDGEVKHPVTGAVLPPKFLGGEVAEIKNESRREALARWLTSPQNPYLARNLANIVWAHFFGRGIIDPADDVRISNPASNPELLGALAGKFVEYKYDFKKIIRDICTSRTYQLSTRANDTNASDERNFSKATIRRIRAEVLLDCISQVTETQDKFPGLPRGAKAVEIADGNTATYFLRTFGRATRATVCSCEVKVDPNLSQALHLLNGDTLQNKIEQGGVVKKMLKEGKTPEQIIENLYLRCFARKPTAGELAKLTQFIHDDAKPEQILNDVFWSLLNAKEFVFNH
jgi:hypothetical protein